MYVAECPEVGTASQGNDPLKRPRKNLKEATELYLEEFPLKRQGEIFHNHLLR